MNISVLHQKMSEALLSGNILAIEILLEIGIPMNLEQLTKETLEDLIFSAVKERNTTIIKSIIHTGIDLNIKNNIGFTLIHNASLKIETLEILINAKVNVNMQDKFGQTALHWAESRGDIDVCKILLDAGADVNIQEMENGQTVLHSAIWKKDIKIAQMLLNAGAVVNLKDKKKRTVLKEVEKTNNPEMIKIIKMHDLKSAFVSNENKIAEIKSTLKFIKFGIDKGFIKFEDVEDCINEMIEELKKLEAIENLNTLLKRIKEGGEQEQSNNSDNIDENSQIMENDLIFTSAGELLNTTNKK